MRFLNTGLIAMLLATAVLSLAHAADPAPPVSPDEPTAAETAAETPVPPSFQPAAKVTLAITLQAPRNWNLNYLVPVRLQFDKEYLKTAPFKVKTEQWDTTIKSYVPEYTIEIPITLAKDLADECLAIPIEVICSVCESTGEQCTFAMETMQLKLIVKSEAGDDDDDNQALAKGTLEYTYRLSLP